LPGGTRGNRHRRIDRAADRGYLAAVPRGRGLAGEAVSLMNWIGLALSLGIGVYLAIALLLPEKFE